MIASIDVGTSYSSICILGPEGKVLPVDISTGASMFGDSIPCHPRCLWMGMEKFW